jgi:hypothetical protein
MPQDWTRAEVDRAVTEYLDMLKKEIANEPVNKAERNRLLQRELPDRSRGSIEFKHQNISAVLLEIGFPYVDGYKPRRNYQELLREVVSGRVAGDFDLKMRVAVAVEVPAKSLKPLDILSILSPPPEMDDKPRRANDRPRVARARTINYLEREAQNRSLGSRSRRPDSAR